MNRRIYVALIIQRSHFIFPPAVIFQFCVGKFTDTKPADITNILPPPPPPNGQ